MAQFSREAETVLRAFGWYPERRVDDAAFRSWFDHNGVTPPLVVMEFLQEFGDLSVIFQKLRGRFPPSRWRPSGTRVVMAMLRIDPIATGFVFHSAGRQVTELQRIARDTLQDDLCPVAFSRYLEPTAWWRTPRTALPLAPEYLLRLRDKLRPFYTSRRTSRRERKIRERRKLRDRSRFYSLQPHDQARVWLIGRTGRVISVNLAPEHGDGILEILGDTPQAALDTFCTRPPDASWVARLP